MQKMQKSGNQVGIENRNQSLINTNRLLVGS